MKGRPSFSSQKVVGVLSNSEQGIVKLFRRRSSSVVTWSLRIFCKCFPTVHDGFRIGKNGGSVRGLKASYLWFDGDRDFLRGHIKTTHVPLVCKLLDFCCICLPPGILYFTIIVSNFLLLPDRYFSSQQRGAPKSQACLSLIINHLVNFFLMLAEPILFYAESQRLVQLLILYRAALSIFRW